MSKPPPPIRAQVRRAEDLTDEDRRRGVAIPIADSMLLLAEILALVSQPQWTDEQVDTAMGEIMRSIVCGAARDKLHAHERTNLIAMKLHRYIDEHYDTDRAKRDHLMHVVMGGQDSGSA
jgi:hypothetical protein